MTVNSYLVNLSSALVLRGTEKDSINTSISTLSSRLTGYFGSNISQQFRFGSSVRETILPRKADENSDIDYMIVFNTSSETLKPQSYLDRIRRFAEKYYSSSQIRQSNPTVVLELDHIKFDLVPAINQYSQYQIPSPASSWSDWIQTDPNGFSQRLTDANMRYNSQIKPLVRLVKYWNASNGHLYTSFSLENYIVGLYFSGNTLLKDYFYTFWDSFSYNYSDPQYTKDKVQRAKERVSSIRQNERQGYEATAENELQKFLPAIS
jgi:hypothetical protein